MASLSSLKRTSSDSSDSSFASKNFKPVPNDFVGHSELKLPAKGLGPCDSLETNGNRDSKLSFINHVLGTNAVALSRYYDGKKEGVDIWSLEMIQDVTISRLDAVRKGPSNNTSITDPKDHTAVPIPVTPKNPESIQPIADIRAQLQEILGTGSLQDAHLRALCSFLSGRDVLVRTPCAGARDLCFQVASVTGKVDNHKGATLIILAHEIFTVDQVLALKCQGIDLFLWASGIGGYTKPLLDSDSALVVCTTPEIFQEGYPLKTILCNMFSIGRLARIVVNDVDRLITADQNPRDVDYRHLESLRDFFPRVPIMGLTSQDVADEIETRLRLRHCVRFSQSFGRKNLSFTVCPKRPNVISDIMEFISTFAKGSAGVVYTLTDSDCSKLTERLAKKFNVQQVLETMSADMQADVVKGWKDGEYHVLVVAFNTTVNLSLDRDDVRFVIHHHLPTSIRRYLEDTFPTGQDGLPSCCRLYYNVADYKYLSSTLESGQHNQAYEIAKYCENDTVCRNALLLQSLGEDSENCGQCDVCRSIGKVIEKDLTSEARDAVRLVQSFAGNSVTLSYCRQLFKNRRMHTVTSPTDIQDSRLFGAGSHLDMEQIERLFDKLCFLDIIDEVRSKTNKASIIVQPGAKIDSIFKSSFVLKLKILEHDLELEDTPGVDETADLIPSAVTETDNDIGNNDPPVFRELKSLRLKIARDMGYSNVDSVLSDQALRQLSLSCPSDFMGFQRAIKDTCDSNNPEEIAVYAHDKWSKFGVDFLRVCMRFQCGETLKTTFPQSHLDERVRPLPNVTMRPRYPSPEKSG